MADKITKFLRKLSSKQLTEVKRVMDLIMSGRFDDLDIKKLSGHNDLFRVRFGRIRIIFAKTKSGNVIKYASFRDDKTYRDF